MVANIAAATPFEAWRFAMVQITIVMDKLTKALILKLTATIAALADSVATPQIQQGCASKVAANPNHVNQGSTILTKIRAMGVNMHAT